MSAAAPSAPPFELLESKLHPPQGPTGTVARTGVISSLEDSQAPPLVLLSAGPGWGKTTLLAQWASRSQRPCAWVSVDEKDNDPIVLLTYVAVALDRVSRLDPNVFDALASAGVSVEATVLPRLGAALTEMSEQVVLLLDDVHSLNNLACFDAIEALSRHVSDGSQMAISARGRPALPIGPLRTHGVALEIGADTLRMNEAEARQLLSAAGLDLADDQVAELTERTEGWPAGLYLAALSIRDRGPRAMGPAPFSGSDRLVSDYLSSELLDYLPADDLRFLMRTAVLGSMSGRLCDEVLQRGDSAAILESYARSNLFVIPLDAQGEWYRYHHLFRELLRAVLMRAEPALVPELLARASAWCEANGKPETAIEYAQAAGDVNRAAWLIVGCGPSVYQSGRVTTAERWLSWLEANGALEQNTAVAILGALLAAAWGRPAEAERWADAAERGSPESNLPDGSASTDSWLALMRAQLCRRGAAEMRTDAELAVGTISHKSQFWPHALGLLAISRWLAGEVDQADDLFAEVVEVGLELGGTDLVMVALGERAAIALRREAWVEAEEHTDRALEIIRRSGMEEYPTAALAYCVAARVRLHRGDIPGAQELLARVQRLRLRLTSGQPYYSVQTRVELARAYLTLADAGGTETVLREIDALLRRQPDLGTLRSEVDELRASVKTMHADAPAASMLTKAELRLLPYLATHLSFREIGERLYVSHNTVRSEAMAVYRKLNVTSRSGAVERARELGLI